MPTWLKVVLGVVAAGIALLALLIGGGAYYWKTHKDELVSMGKEAMESGVAFGRTTDSKGCTDEGLRRLAGLSSLTEEIKNNLFTAACLGAATPTPGFCDGVPPESEIMKTVGWRTAQCSQHTHLDMQRCQRFMQVWQKNCHEGAPGSTPPN